MTKKELQELPVGTLLYNGRTEGIIRMDGRDKVIEVFIPISAMSNDAKDFNDRPEWWSVLEETE